MSIRFKQLLFKHKHVIISSSIISLICFSAFLFSINRAKIIPDAIVIRNENDFYKINDNLSGYYVLADSIVFSKPVQPIGSYERPFTGTFDGLGRYVLKNVVFDFAEIDLEKYTQNGVTNIGLFSYNKGVIIHNEISNISFLNTNSLGYRKVNLGVVAGLNEGKITSNYLYTPNYTTSIGEADEINFGLFSGYNSGEIRRCRIIGHINCAFSSINKVSLGAFSGFGTGKPIYEMLQFNGNISIYNSNETEVKKISCGCISGSLDGGKIKNCDLQKASVFNMKKNVLHASCGGIVGNIVYSFGSVSISSSVITGTIRSSAFAENYVSSGVGEIDQNSIVSFASVLIGGECTTYYVTATEEKISDLYYSKLQNLKHEYCAVLDNYQIKNPFIKSIKTVVSLNELTVNKMRWDDSCWSIESGVIHFKAFDL